MNPRFSMLLSMAAATVAVVSILTLAGCQKSAANTGQQASTHPVSGGSLTWGVTTEPVCFDPHRASQQNAFFLIRNVVDSLIAKKANGSSVAGDVVASLQ
jgi:peptide/nickel transport system substrate-binding protein